MSTTTSAPTPKQLNRMPSYYTPHHPHHHAPSPSASSTASASSADSVPALSSSSNGSSACSSPIALRPLSGTHLLNLDEVVGRVLASSSDLDYLCACCDLNNDTGYTCPNPIAIPHPPGEDKASAAASRGDWQANLIRSERFRDTGCAEHHECAGCHGWLPDIPDRADLKCASCHSHLCSNLLPSGCPRSILLRPLSAPCLPRAAATWLHRGLTPCAGNRSETCRMGAALLEKYGAPEAIVSAILEVLPLAKGRAGAEGQRDLGGRSIGLDEWFCESCTWREIVVGGIGELWKRERPSMIERRASADRRTYISSAVSHPN